MAVADTGNDRIQVFSPNGTFLLGYGQDLLDGPLSVDVGLHVARPPSAVEHYRFDPDHPRVIDVTESGEAANLTISVAGLADAGVDISTDPASNQITIPRGGIILAASFAEVFLPPGATAAPVPPDGLLSLYVTANVPTDRQVGTSLAYDGSGPLVLQRVVEIGDEQVGIAFSIPVRIALDGQADGRAFYIDSADGSIVPVDRICAADDVERAHRQLGGAGACHLDSDSGDKVLYAYHMTRFGTAVSERGALPPSFHTCSVDLGLQELDMSASPGGYSAAAPQVLINSGSLQIDHVSLDATPWYIDLDDATPALGHPSLPSSITEVSEEGQYEGFEAVDEAGTAIGRGLAGGQDAHMWFKINLAGYDRVQGSSLDQYVTYLAQCNPPP